MKLKQNQHGAALFVALILLLAITLLGVSSLKSGVFHERMSLNSQADALSFMATESSINSIISFAWQIGQNGVDESFFARSILGVPQKNCISKDAVIEGDCSADDTFDRRASGILIAQAETDYNGQAPAENSDAKILAFHKFTTAGNAYFVQDLELPFAYRNIQGWKKLGVPKGFSFSSGEIEQ